MNAVDFILGVIEEKGLTQTEAARICGMSRQNLWDKLNNGNMRFQSMYRILKAFGFKVEVLPIGDAKPISDQGLFITVAENENIPYESMERILEAIGYRINIFQ